MRRETYLSVEMSGTDNHRLGPLCTIALLLVERNLQVVSGWNAAYHPGS